MDYLAQRFIALASKLRDHLARLNEVIEKHRESIDKAETTYREQRQTPPQIRAELHIPQAVEDQRTEQYQHSHRLQRHQVIAAYLTVAATALAFAAAAGYAWIAAGQLREMREATRQATIAAKAANNSAETQSNAFTANQQQFRTEQRPWIWISPGVGISPSQLMTMTPLSALKRMGIPLTIDILGVNGGHSPGVEVLQSNAEMIFDTSKKAEEMARSYVPHLNSSVGTVIAPGSTFFFPDNFPAPTVTDDLLNSLAHDSKRMYVVGYVQYRDVFEPKIAPYETWFCFRIHASGMPYGTCPFGNGIK